ncbi:MAG TPA: TIGR03560 family F420-dependent LLM class oxidoreductase [Acidimicrobiales bacterium]|nr:TIGR03560 family F420-dependent LLM class oxidoreductase [Acidimicrobiales bacterium]
MQLGIQTAQWGADFVDILAVWEHAERLGYRSAWLMDHFVPVVAPSTEPMLESWVTLAALLARTSAIRGGVLVSANTFRHPALLAHMAATADRVSGGRLEVGLGAAWNAEEHRARGMAFPPVRDRMDMLEEAVQVLRALWTEPVADFEGRHYRLEQATCEPKPVQAHLPVLIGGRGERRTLRTVARYADRWNGSGSVEMLSASADVLRRHCDDAGRDPATIALTVMNECYVTEDASDAHARREHAGRFRGMGADEVRDRVWIGNADEVRAQLGAFDAAGFDEAILGLNPPYGARTLELLEALMG